MGNRYEEAARILNDMASVKMAMNSHKGRIEDASPRELLELLKKEVDELQAAGETVHESDTTALLHILEEAADVQNFLLALVHQQVEKYRSRK